MNCTPLFTVCTLFFVQASGAKITGKKPALEEIYWGADTTGDPVLNPEHAVSYWREDEGLNTLHWNWHVVYPVPAVDHKLDRKGELFFYMHRQMMHRYNNERLSVKLPRVLPITDWTEPIAEGYAPHLVHGDTGTPYAVRAENTVLADLPGITSMKEMNDYRQRIYDAIDFGSLILPNGDLQNLDMRNLGNTVEANYDCPNLPYYGGAWGMHNFGHFLISMIQDPTEKYMNRDIGVMGDVATAVRDPAFYRWHTFVDDTFERYLQGLTPYTDADLEWSDVKVESVEVVNSQDKVSKTLKTHKEDIVARMRYWPDFKGRGRNVKLTYVTLNHEDFSYKIKVKNTKSSPVKATVRIFMVPKKNQYGSPLDMDEVRRLYMEMDTFIADIPSGDHTITRKSEDASVSIPLKQMIDSLQLHDEDKEAERAYCGCGWPHNLLIPRGYSGVGKEFTLLVMLTNFNVDKVDMAGGDPLPTCQKAYSYCGLLNNKFPDSHDMGFPFDRRADATCLGGFIDGKSNFGTGEVNIVYEGWRSTNTK